MSGLQVCKERCNSCLYRLKYDRQTRNRILNEVTRNDTYVACHNMPEGTVCRGFYDANDEACNLMRIAKWLRCVEFVGLPEKARIEEGEE